MHASEAPLEREAFLAELAENFPEVVASFDDIGNGLLHLEMAAFRRMAECAMDEGRHWQVELYLRFLESCLKRASPALENAIYVSFLEDFALGEFTELRHQAVRERMPQLLRNFVLEVNGKWR